MSRRRYLAPVAITIDRAVALSSLNDFKTKWLSVSWDLGVKRIGLVGNCHFHTELLSLIIGPRHQRHAANARRKAQIIFDTSRSSSLAAEGTAIEHQYRQTFRRGVNRRGKSRRTRTDNGHIVNAAGIDRSHHSNAPGEFIFSRIAQQLTARAQDDRQVLAIKVEAFYQRFGIRIGIGIEVFDVDGRCAREILQAEGRRHSRPGR